MNTQTIQKSVAASLVLAVAIFSQAGAAPDKATVVKERQLHMKSSADDNKAILDYSKGRTTKEAAEKAIADLKARNAKTLSYFADKSTSAADMPGVSKAKPEIWTDKAKFTGFVTALKTQIDKQEKLIKTGTPEEVGAAQAELGKTGCGGCHGAFRAQAAG